jgi:hypothetical protein
VVEDNRTVRGKRVEVRLAPAVTEDRPGDARYDIKLDQVSQAFPGRLRSDPQELGEERCSPTIEPLEEGKITDGCRVVLVDDLVQGDDGLPGEAACSSRRRGGEFGHVALRIVPVALSALALEQAVHLADE